MHICSSFLRIGSLSALLSDHLRSAFTTGVAFHVIASQAADLLGLEIPKYQGVLKIAYYTRDVYLKIWDANLVTLTITLTGTVFLLLMYIVVSPFLAKKFTMPLPYELFVVLAGTAVVYYLKIDENYDVCLVGYIPQGLPGFKLPPVELLSGLAVDVIPIAIVSYSVAMAVSSTYAQKHQYNIRLNQDLLAIGIANVVGSFFSCIPLACSSSRSAFQEQSGGKTQVASVVSAIFIILTIYFVAPIFEWLPRASISTISLAAAITMILQFRDLKRFSQEGFLEVFLWICTFLAVVFTDIPIGLFIGLAISLLSIYIKSWRSRSYILGLAPDTDIYVDIKTHELAVEIPRIKIFKFCGAINFLTRSGFKNKFMKKVQRTVEDKDTFDCNQNDGTLIVSNKLLLRNF